MSAKNKNLIFICAIGENILKVAKCIIHANAKSEFVGLEFEMLASNIDDKKLSENLNQLLKKLKYAFNPLIISLPRGQATCRYLKVPALIPEEIEKIVYLQAPRYLPYPTEELITGFQIISSDKEGSSQINLSIVHKEVIERYLKIFNELKTSKLGIFLNSYGLCELYNYIKPTPSETTMVVELDYQQAELAIISAKKLIFSRSFKLSRTSPDWVSLLVDELNKTQDAYLKDISKDAPQRIIVVGAEKLLQQLPEVLNKQLALPVEVLSYSQKLGLSKNLSDTILNSEHSFASLIGLGLGKTEGSLNLLPEEMKKEVRKIVQRKGRLRMMLSISAIILLLGSSIARDFDNRAKYLEQLKAEMNKIAKEAKPLEDIEKRFALLDSQSDKKTTTLGILYELHQLIPDSISLLNLGYEENKFLLLRGQSSELNSVSLFVEELKKSPIFKGFDIKLRYATEKKTQEGEIVDFEIECLLRKSPAQ